MSSGASKREAGVSAQLFAIFFLSGLASLIYQTVWIRKFSLALGGTAYSMSIVVSTFMAGLAVGAAALGRLSDRTKRPLVLYAGIELGIAACALVVAYTDGLRETMARALIKSETLEGTLLVRVVMVVLWLGLPCFLIGGTLPVMVRFIVKRLSAIGQRVGTLYFVNTLGAAAGTLLTSFVLIELLGLKGTNALAAGINVLVALAALAISRRVDEPADEPVAAEPAAPTVAATASRSLLIPALAFFFSGFSALLLEMSWTRLVMGFLNASPFIISVNLAIILVGFAIGGVLTAKLADRTQSPRALAALLFACTALAGVVGLLNAEPLAVSAGLGGDPYFPNWLQLVSVIGIMLPASLCMGMTFPVLVRILVVERDRVGQQLGGFYALNTLGTVLGGVAAPFLFIPWVGTSNAIIIAIGLQLAMAVALRLDARGETVGALGKATVAAGLAALAVLPLNLDVYHEALRIKAYSKYPNWAEERAYVEGADSTVVLYEAAQGTYQQVQNDQNRFRVQVNASELVAFDTNETKLMAHLPLLAVKEPKRALVICFGVGNTFRSALAHDIEVDVADINPAIPGLARIHQKDPSRTFDNPKGRIIINDGRNFLLLTDKTYDMITLDPAPPIWQVGMSNIQTLEFYRLLADRLSPDGVAESWMLAFSTRDFLMSLKAFREVFPYVAVFKSRSYYAYHVLGSRKPIVMSEARLQRLFNDPKLREDLGETDITYFQPGIVSELFVTDQDGVDQLTKSYDALEDDKPVIEYQLLTASQGGGAFSFPDSVKKPLVLSP